MQSRHRKAECMHAFEPCCARKEKFTCNVGRVHVCRIGIFEARIILIYLVPSFRKVFVIALKNSRKINAPNLKKLFRR